MIRLVHNDIDQSLQAWGIEPGARLRLTGDGSDSLTFTVKGGSFAPSQFTPLATVEIVDRDGVRRFLGVLTSPRRRAVGNEIVWDYRCASPDYWLRGRQAAQTWKMITAEVVPDVAESEDFVDSALSITRIGKQTCAVSIDALIDQIATAGGLVSLDDSYLPGEGGDEADKPPEDYQPGLTVLGAIEAQRGYFPYCGRRWNYAGTIGGAAQLQFYSTLRPGHLIGDLPASPFTTRTVADASGADGLEELSAEALHELLISKMTVQFLKRHRVIFSGGGVIAGQLITVDHTVANGAFAQQSFAIELRPSVWNGTTYTAAEEAQLGLAKQLGAAFFHLPYRISWREKRGEPVWSRVPGELYNITGADAALETAYSPLRAVTYDLHTGETMCECDPGTQPGIATLAELLRKLRDRQVPDAGDAGAQDFGFEPDGAPGEGESEWIVLVHKVDKTVVRLTVKGTTAAAEAGDTIKAVGGTGDADATTVKVIEFIGTVEDPA